MISISSFKISIGLINCSFALVVGASTAMAKSAARPKPTESEPIYSCDDYCSSLIRHEWERHMANTDARLKTAIHGLLKNERWANEFLSSSKQLLNSEIVKASQFYIEQTSLAEAEFYIGEITEAEFLSRMTLAESDLLEIANDPSVEAEFMAAAHLWEPFLERIADEIHPDFGFDEFGVPPGIEAHNQTTKEESETIVIQGKKTRSPASSDDTPPSYESALSAVGISKEVINKIRKNIQVRPASYQK
jgi:hypothetical protein